MSQDIIVALCETQNRCTICYRGSTGSNCDSCKNYYLDCTCTPLTRQQIEEGIDF